MTQPRTTIFEVYTNFGQVISSHKVGPDETYHRAAEEARLSCFHHHCPAWVRMKEASA